MHGLEVPHDLASAGPDGDDRIGVMVVADALAAEIVRARAAGGHEHEIPRRVGGDRRPGIRGSAAVPHRAVPTIPARIGRVARHRVPAPAQLTSAGIEGPHLTAGCVSASVVGDRRAGDDRSADDRGWRGQLVLLEIVRRVMQAPSQSDRPVLAESGAGRAPARVEGDDASVDGAEEDASPACRVRRCRWIEPGRDTTIREIAPLAADVGVGVEDPTHAAGLRVERDGAAPWRRQIEGAVDHQRRRLEVRIAANAKSV